MAKKKRLFWSAVGSVRGDCKHMHRTIRGAAECVLRDREPRSRIPSFEEFGQVRSMLARKGGGK